MTKRSGELIERIKDYRSRLNVSWFAAQATAGCSCFHYTSGLKPV